MNKTQVKSKVGEKKTITQKEFEKVVATPIKDVQYMLHKIVSIIRRINRDEKLNDEEIAMLHQDIDLFFRNY